MENYIFSSNTEIVDFENLPTIMYGDDTIEYLKCTL